MTGIYKIENIVSLIVYVGKTINIKNRWKQHIAALNENKHCNTHLQRAWNKYGPENFKFEILELCNKNKLSEREKYWINYYGGIESKNTYNIIEGGIGGCGNKEWKQKISNTVKQHYINGDYDCRKKGTTCWVKKDNEQHRINKSQLENYLKRGWIKGKLSIPLEHRNKMRKYGSENGFYGKHHSEESKNKMRKKHNISKKIHNKLSEFNKEKFKKLKWVNNGIINKRIKNINEYLDKGWKLGRLPLPQISKSLKEYFARRNKHDNI